MPSGLAANVRFRTIFSALCAVSTCFGALALFAELSCLPELSTLEVDDAAVIGPSGGCGNGIIEEAPDGGQVEQCDRGDSGAPGCSPTCTIECEGEIDPRSGHCYFRAGAHGALIEARQACVAVGAHVVTVGDEDESARASRLATGAHWLGLERRDSLGGYVTTETAEPGWPLAGRTCAGCFGFADGGGLPSASTDGGTALGCVVRSESGAWLEAPCTGASGLATVCEREPRGQRGQACGGGICFSLPATTPGKRSLVVPSPASAREAAAFCANQFAGRLAVLGSQAERAQIARELLRFFPPEPVSTFWIGLGLVGAEWRWDDDAGLSERPVPWGDGQPRGTGAARAYLRLSLEYDTQLAHADDDAAATRPFICER